MADIRSTAEMSFQIVLTLSEDEAKALRALTEYGTDAFLKFFYQHMGTQFLRPYENELRSLFDHIKSHVPRHIRRINRTRAEFLHNK